MFALNGNRQRLSDLIFATVDCLLVLAGVLGAIFVRLSTPANYFLLDEYVVLKIMLLVALIQVGFYYFDLYDSRLYVEKKKMFVLFAVSLLVSSLFAIVIYYLMPSLQVGRGIFVISFVLIFIFSFSWRLLYARVYKLEAFTERVLIIGTGALAKKIEEELTNNGYHGFRIVGFIDESREKIGRRV